MTRLVTLEWDEFVKTYIPRTNHLDDNASFDGCLYETYGEEIEYVKRQAPDVIWTIVEDDDAELVLVSGWHYVNRLGYILTEKPVPEDITVQVLDN